MRMGTDMFWNLLMVFACVLVPFLVADLLVDLPRGKHGLPAGSTVPPVYRRLHGLFAWFADRIRPGGIVLSTARALRIENQLRLANWSLAPSLVAGAQAAFSLLGGGFVLLAEFFLGVPVGLSILLAMVAAFFGWVYPAVKLEKTAETRQNALIRSLPFAIDLIGSAMRSGLDFNAAVRYYLSLGIGGPLPVEFGAMLRQSELGKSRLEALQEMASRVQTDSFTSFVDTVSHGIEVGASIVDTMKMQGEDMRRARFHLAERQAARAPSLMLFPMAFFLMPAVFVVVGTPIYFQMAQSGM